MKIYKIISITIIIIIITTLFFACELISDVQDENDSGTPGLSYTLINNETEYSVSNGIAGENSTIIIPNMYNGKIVSSIDSFAFFNCSNLRNITIPSGIISIGNSAFLNCTSLSDIIIPDSVTSIGSDAFSGCSELMSINIPSNLKSISTYVFENCCSLTSIIIPEGVTSIGHDAFHICTSLTNVIIPSTVTNIGYQAFSSCISLTNVTINAEFPPNLDFWAFNYDSGDYDTLPNLKIYVPSESIDAYKTTDGWSDYADKIYAIEN